MCILRICLWLLRSSVGWSFCVLFHLIFNIGRLDLRSSMFAWNVLQCLEHLRSPRSEKSGKYYLILPDTWYVCFSYGNACLTLFWAFWWPEVGGDMFSPLSPILGHEKKVAMPPSSTVHGGQYDTKYLVCNIRTDGASGIREGDNFRHLPWTRSYQPRDRNTRNRTRIYYNLSARTLRARVT